MWERFFLTDAPQHVQDTTNFSVGIVGCVDVVALEGFIDALSGYSVPFCKFFDCYKVNLIGGDDVNFYPGCQFHALPPSVIV